MKKKLLKLLLIINNVLHSTYWVKNRVKHTQPFKVTNIPGNTLTWMLVFYTWLIQCRRDCNGFVRYDGVTRFYAVVCWAPPPSAYIDNILRKRNVIKDYILCDVRYYFFHRTVNTVLIYNDMNINIYIYL